MTYYTITLYHVILYYSMASEVIGFLLQTEIIPLCLRIMETGSELSKPAA